jgi:hypothetical protein
VWEGAASPVMNIAVRWGNSGQRWRLRSLVMADTANDVQHKNLAQAGGDATSTNGSTSSAPPRRPYHAPHLRYLGSVRELTLGSGTVTCDAQGQGVGTGSTEPIDLC